MSMWNRGPFSGGFGSGNMGGFAPADDSMAGSPAVASFFNAVYGWMGAGLGLTALVAWLVARAALSGNPSVLALMHGPMLFGLFIAQFVLVIAISAAVQRISANVATAMFLAYSALNGVTLSGIFLVYANVTLAGTFLVTAITFAAMSLYGMVTQRDLTRFGSILFMALIGIVVASIVNLFFASSALYTLITYVGVLLFVGLTAFDTQRLKGMAIGTSGNAAMAARYSVVGALMLYLDFLNLFLFLLQILGNADRRK
jgi:uncharacterized protein